MYGSRKLCTFVIFPKECVQKMAEMSTSVQIYLNYYSPGDQDLPCCSQQYSSPSSLSPNRDKVSHWIHEHVSTLDCWDNGEEQRCPGSYVGFGHIYGAQFPSSCVGVTSVELFFSQDKSGWILQHQPHLADALPSSDWHNDSPATTFPEASAEDKKCFQKYLETTENGVNLL